MCSKMHFKIHFDHKNFICQLIFFPFFGDFAGSNLLLGQQSSRSCKNTIFHFSYRQKFSVKNSSSTDMFYTRGSNSVESPGLRS